MTPDFEVLIIDKEKGFVKGENILSGAEHRLLSTSERVGPRLWDITAESFFWWIAPPNHRYDQNDYHDFAIRTSSRRVCAEVGNTGGVFPRRLRRLLHRPVWMREHPINVSG
jgi:hypothetical protein